MPQHRPLRHWEIDREWTKTVGALLIPRSVCNKYSLPPPSLSTEYPGDTQDRVCKRDMKTGSINPANWETQVADRSSWRTATRTGIRVSERRRREQWEEKKEHKKQMAEITAEPGAKTFKYSHCIRVCGSRIGLFSQSRRCSNPSDTLWAHKQPIVSRDRSRPTTKTNRHASTHVVLIFQ